MIKEDKIMILKYKTQWQNSLENPYRFFFPFSFIGIFWGLGILFFPLKDITIFWHKEIVITLYLLPIINGFLYTAVPRFFNSFFAKADELFFTLFLLLSLFLFAAIRNLVFYSFFKFFYLLFIFFL